MTNPLTVSRVDELINTLKLIPHPSEGGYYVRSFRSKSTHQLDRGTRNCSGVIYYLLRGNDINPWHKLKGDEYYCFYEGCSLSVHLIYPGCDSINVVTLGRDVSRGEAFHVEIPADTWVASCPTDTSSYTLIGNPTAPAYEQEDCVLAERQDLEHVRDERKVKFFARN